MMIAKKTKVLKKRFENLIRYISKNDFALAFVSVAIIVVLAVGLGLQNNKNVPVNSWAPAHYHQEPNNHLSFLANWDGIGYISIAQHGYSSLSLTNYFPLYPLLIRIVHQIVSSELYSSLIVSWFAFAGALYFYLKIIKKYFRISDSSGALRAALFFLLFPTGIFLVASYTESLFAFLSLGAIYYSLTRRYLLSGIFLLFDTATHVNGLFVLILVLGLLYEEKERILNIIKTFLLGILGILGYMFYLTIKFRDPLEFVKQQSALHGWLKHSFFSLLGTVSPLQYVFVLGILISAIYWWPRKKSFSIYSFLYILIPLIGGSFGSFARYSLMVFPLQFMIYEKTIKNPFAYSLCLAAFSIGWAYFTLQFTGGYVS